MTIDASLTVQSGPEARWIMPDGSEQTGPAMSFPGDGNSQTFTAWVQAGTADTFNCATQSVTDISVPLTANLKNIIASSNAALVLDDTLTENAPNLTELFATDTASVFTDDVTANATGMVNLFVSRTNSSLTDDVTANATSITELGATDTPSVFTNAVADNADNMRKLFATDTASVFTDDVTANSPNMVLLLAARTNSVSFTNAITANATGMEELSLSESDCSAITGVLALNATGLKDLTLADTQIPQAGIDSILAQLVANGLSGGFVNLSGPSNGVPGVQGIIDAGILGGNGWTVITN